VKPALSIRADDRTHVHRWIDQIFDSGDPESIAAVRTLLRTQARSLQRQPRRKPGPDALTVAPSQEGGPHLIHCPPVEAWRIFVPLKRQWLHTLLLFPLGEYYCLYCEDAVVASRELQLPLKLANRDGGVIPMCDFALDRLESYTAVLMDRGHEVALCGIGPPKEDPARKNVSVKVVSQGLQLIDCNQFRQPSTDGQEGTP
jgi:hypothetical protein